MSNTLLGGTNRIWLNFLHVEWEPPIKKVFFLPRRIFSFRCAQEIYCFKVFSHVTIAITKFPDTFLVHMWRKDIFGRLLVARWRCTMSRKGYFQGSIFKKRKIMRKAQNCRCSAWFYPFSSIYAEIQGTGDVFKRHWYCRIRFWLKLIKSYVIWPF